MERILNMRLDSALLDAVDAWAAKGRLSRSEALRLLMSEATENATILYTERGEPWIEWGGQND